MANYTHMYDVKVGSFPEISEEMNKRAVCAANRTWDAIGADCLVDDEGNYDENKSITRDDMLELVRDASHMECYGGDNEASAYLIWLGWFHPDFYKEWIKTAFPFEYYGS